MATTAVSSGGISHDYAGTPKINVRRTRRLKDSSGKILTDPSGDVNNLPQINEFNQGLTFGKGNNLEINRTINWQ